jgi:probable F420-dependent oxidoreductase
MTHSDALPDLGRVGIWTAGFDLLSPAELADTVAELDELGFGAAWFGEAYGREAFTQAQLLLAASKQIVIATGIANIWARDAMACNAAARTLSSEHPGRFLLGLGVSHQPLVARMRGHRYDKPLSAMRSYLRGMDMAPYTAWEATAPRPTRVLAALAPGMLATARDQADGAHPYLTLPEHTAMAREVLGPDKLLAPEVSCVLTDDVDVWRQRAHTHLELYTGLPNYVGNWLRMGFTHGDAVRGGSDRLKSALVCRGIEATMQAVNEHHAAGADHVCVQVLGEMTFSAPMHDWRILAEAIR